MGKGTWWTQAANGPQDQKAPAGKEKSTKVKYPAFDFLFEMWRKSGRKCSQLHKDSHCNFKSSNKAPAHLDGSWRIGRWEFPELGSSHCVPGIHPVLETPLSVVPFSALQTSSDTTGGQMYFWWSRGHLSTISRGHRISMTKQMTKGQRGILRTKSGLGLYLSGRLSFRHVHGSPRSFCDRGRKAASASQGQKNPVFPV